MYRLSWFQAKISVSETFTISWLRVIENLIQILVNIRHRVISEELSFLVSTAQQVRPGLLFAALCSLNCFQAARSLRWIKLSYSPMVDIFSKRRTS